MSRKIVVHYRSNADQKWIALDVHVTEITTAGELCVEIIKRLGLNMQQRVRLISGDTVLTDSDIVQGLVLVAQPD